MKSSPPLFNNCTKWTKSRIKKHRVVREQSGVSVIATAITLPVVILVIVVCYDLTSIYLNIIFAQDVALTTAKLANSSNPYVDTPATSDLIKEVPSEDGAITSGREDFWADQIDENSDNYHGVDYFTEKELKTFNLAYGYMNNLKSNIAFPIPAIDPLEREHLAGVTNCSIYFSFVDLGVTIDLTYNYSRLYTVECAIPLWGLSLFGNAIAQDGYIKVSRTAYAHQSGGLNP